MSINKKEYLSIFYFISRSMFLGVGFSFMYKFSGTDALISMILGFILGNVFIILFDITSKKINYNLNNLFNQNNLISKIYKIIFISLYLYLIIYISTIFTNFVKVYYLFETPLYATLLFLFIICYYASTKTEKSLIRTASIFINISVVIIMLIALLLLPFSEFNNILPILNTSSTSLLKGALVFTVFSSLPNILLIEYKVKLSTKLKSYAFISSLLLLTNYFIITVLGKYLIETYSYPEYMVLRRIRFLDFIENIENFAAIVWYFDAFIMITLCLVKFKKILEATNKDKYILPLLVIISFIAHYIFNNYFISLSIFFESGIIILSIYLILLGPILSLLLKKKIAKLS